MGKGNETRARDPRAPPHAGNPATRGRARNPRAPTPTQGRPAQSSSPAQGLRAPAQGSLRAEDPWAPSPRPAPPPGLPPRIPHPARRSPLSRSPARGHRAPRPHLGAPPAPQLRGLRRPLPGNRRAGRPRPRRLQRPLAAGGPSGAKRGGRAPSGGRQEHRGSLPRVRPAPRSAARLPRARKPLPSSPSSGGGGPSLQRGY